jgi:hypothetical protein
MDLLLPLAQVLQVQQWQQLVTRLLLLPVAGGVASVRPAAVVYSPKPKWRHIVLRRTVTLSWKAKCTM